MVGTGLVRSVRRNYRSPESVKEETSATTPNAKMQAAASDQRVIAISLGIGDPNIAERRTCAATALRTIIALFAEPPSPAAVPNAFRFFDNCRSTCQPADATTAAEGRGSRWG